MGTNPDYAPNTKDGWIDRGDSETRVIALAVTVLLAGGLVVAVRRVRDPDTGKDEGAPR